MKYTYLKQIYSETVWQNTSFDTIELIFDFAKLNFLSPKFTNYV
jgi:hypothetical protein